MSAAEREVTPRPICTCGRGNRVTTEVEGRVLVCAECAADPVFREDTRRNWR